MPMPPASRACLSTRHTPSSSKHPGIRCLLRTSSQLHVKIPLSSGSSSVKFGVRESCSRNTAGPSTARAHAPCHEGCTATPLPVARPGHCVSTPCQAPCLAGSGAVGHNNSVPHNTSNQFAPHNAHTAQSRTAQPNAHSSPPSHKKHGAHRLAGLVAVHGRTEQHDATQCNSSKARAALAYSASDGRFTPSQVAFHCLS